MEQVIIHSGKLSIGMLDYQLFTTTGEKATVSYRGMAGVNGSKIRIGSGRVDTVDYIIANRPTPESVEWTNGFEKAQSQKRRRLPKDYTQKWFSGWRAGWELKTKGW